MKDQPPPVADAAPSGLFARLSDRLNPILVREVHQALGGKGFVVTASLALLAILIIALTVATQEEVSPRDGADAFLYTLQVLIPILFFIVPFQAFLSTRSEVGGGTVEHLLMSRLSPGAIVRGKLYAATVQFMIYLAIFSPLLAMTFLLRGVDVPTIAIALAQAFVFALGCSALAIACGSLCRWPAFFKVIPFAVVLVGLGGFTMAAMAGADEILDELRTALSEDAFTYWMGSLALMPLTGSVFFAMIGSAALAHPYENRSTKFRIFAFAFVAISFGWTLYTYSQPLGRAVRPYAELGDQLGVAASMCALVLALFPLFAATEAPELTPRVRTRVPRNPVLAFLATPFLPGCGRGLLFSLLLAATTLLSLKLLPALWGAPPMTGALRERLLAAWLYLVLFAAIGCRVRASLSSAETRNWWARATLPGLLLVGTFVPLLLSLIAGRGVLFGWNPLHLLNPFLTMDRMRYAADEILGWLVAVTLLALLVNVVPVARGLREVLAASRDRRSRAP